MTTFNELVLFPSWARAAADLTIFADALQAIWGDIAWERTRSAAAQMIVDAADQACIKLSPTQLEAEMDAFDEALCDELDRRGFLPPGVAANDNDPDQPGAA